jgi:hypothetical protein
VNACSARELPFFLKSRTHPVTVLVMVLAESSSVGMIEGAAAMSTRLSTSFLTILIIGFLLTLNNVFGVPAQNVRANVLRLSTL